MSTEIYVNAPYTVATSLTVATSSAQTFQFVFPEYADMFTIQATADGNFSYPGGGGSVGLTGSVDDGSTFPAALPGVSWNYTAPANSSAWDWTGRPSAYTPGGIPPVPFKYIQLTVTNTDSTLSHVFSDIVIQAFSRR